MDYEEFGMMPLLPIVDAKDRDMLITSNLSDVQELISMGQTKEANDRINAIKMMMVKTRDLLKAENNLPNGMKLVHEVTDPFLGKLNFDSSCDPFHHCD